METESVRFPVTRFLLIGILLAIGPLLAYASGVFETWQPITPPPAGVYRFEGVYQAGFGSGNLVVRGADGSLYRYLYTGTAGWDSQVLVENVVDGPCLGRAIMARLVQPFQQELSCLSTIVPSEWLGGSRVTYVRDDQGKLWMWQQDNGGTFFLLALPAILIGLMLGYLLALLWHPLVMVLRPPLHNERPARWSALLAWEERTLRTGARVWSIFSVIALLGVLLVFGDDSQTAFRISALAGLAALAAAWRWERLGGGLAVLVSIAGLTALTWPQPSGWLAALSMVALLYFPAPLFLAADAIKKKVALYTADTGSGML